jgi:peptide/nickel transport system substrate-binding protein
MRKWILILALISQTAFAYKIAISSSPSNLSPFFSTDANSQNINRLVHTSLVDFNLDMKPVCRLCTSYEERRTKDSYSIVFKLRDDVKFWDGTPVTAKDIVSSWKYFTETDKIKSIFRFAFGNIKEVKILSKYEVELIYKSYGLDHLPNLVLMKILKIPNYKKVNKETKVQLSDIIGAAEYKYGPITSLNVGLRSLSKDLKDLEFVVVKDETTLSLKLINGEVDLSLANMSPRKIGYLEKLGKVNVQKISGTNYNYIGINHKKEVFKDKNFRRALSLLIPRAKIIKHKFKDNATISTGLYSKPFKELYTNKFEDSFNPKLANELLVSAGMKKVNGKWVDKTGKPIKLLWKCTNNKFILELVEIIKRSYEDFGIEIELVVQEWGTFLRGLKRGEYDLFVGKWVGFTGPDMIKFAFHSKNLPPKGANRVHYVNSELDALLDRAEGLTDKSKRNAIYRDAIEVVNSDYAYINLWHPSVIWVMNKCLKVEGMYPNGNMLALRNIRNVCTGR